MTTAQRSATKVNAFACGLVLAALLVASLLVAGSARATTTFTVNSLGDIPEQDPGDGVCNLRLFRGCTLRAAIQEANATAGADTINFNISGSGVKTIRPTSPLPEITEAVTIAGYSQPGASPTPRPSATTRSCSWS